MKHLVQVSGGLGSFIETALCVQEFGRHNVIALFADTQMEDEDLYRFLDESVKVLDIQIHKLSDGRTPWQVFHDVSYLGNTRSDPCSRILKRELLWKWIESNFLPSDVEIHFGIDASESHRLKTLSQKRAPFICRSLAVERQMMLTTQEKMDFCKRYEIEPPRLYMLGFSHNNCGGFCVKAGLAQFKLLLETMPERYEWHVQQERALRSSRPKVRPFLRRTINGDLTYIWLEDYRNELLAGKELRGEEKFDFGGCGCAL